MGRDDGDVVDRQGVSGIHPHGESHIPRANGHLGQDVDEAMGGGEHEVRSDERARADVLPRRRLHLLEQGAHCDGLSVGESHDGGIEALRAVDDRLGRDVDGAPLVATGQGSVDPAVAGAGVVLDIRRRR